jgi:hypothetical protein
MKKIIFTLFICLISVMTFGQSQFKRGIEVGTRPNAALIDSVDLYGNIFRVFSGATRIYDDKLLQDATELSTIVPLLADSTVNYVTPTQMAGYMGSGGTVGKFYYLKGRVGITDGLPNSGDSVLTNTGFIGKYLLFFREGQIQEQNTDNTQTDGFWFNNTTGTATIRPVLSTGEQIYILASNTILFEALIPEGGGGEPPPTPSVLLDSLVAVWEFDEVAGNSFSEEVGGYTGTGYLTTPNQPGKLGVAVKIGYQGAVVVPYTSALAVVGDRISLSAWFKLDTLPSVSGHVNRLITLWDNTYHTTHSLYVYTDNKIWGQVTNTTESEYYVSSAGMISMGVLYQAVLVCEGTGRTLKLYTNGTQAAGNAFSGTLHTFDGNITIGNQQNGYNQSVSGVIDQVVYSRQRFTPADIILLYGVLGVGNAFPF